VSLNQIRYQQQYQQLQQFIKPGAGTVVTYATRDPITGARIVEAADGGRQIAQYLSNSAPDDVLALSQSSTIGLAGYISQKPH
jgi:hypothetical protein